MHRTCPEPAAAGLADSQIVDTTAEDDWTVSAQAMRLHTLASVAALLTDRHGLIGRREAERLADSCGALVDELLEAGLWDETDVSYVINALAT